MRMPRSLRQPTRVGVLAIVHFAALALFYLPSTGRSPTLAHLIPERAAEPAMAILLMPLAVPCIMSIVWAKAPIAIVPIAIAIGLNSLTWGYLISSLCTKIHESIQFWRQGTA